MCMDRMATLNITLNGEAFVTRSRTLAELVAEAGFGDAKVATAVNGMFVAAAARARAELAAGDKVEVVSARQGG
jgi:sulfur carrier protein